MDPHKGSHTAVVIDPAEEPLGELRVRASAAQAQKLIAWAAAWPERTWVVEGASGLGHLLAWQLTPPGSGSWTCSPSWPPGPAAAGRDTNKNDPNDALSVAIAALRSRSSREVVADDCAAVLKVWSKRHRDLARNRNQVACGLHTVLRPGTRRPPKGDFRSSGHQDSGIGRAIRCHRAGPRELAAEFLADLRYLDGQLLETKKKLAAAVRASHTTLTEVFGAGPVIAGTIIGDAGDVFRFPGPGHLAACNGTAPAGCRQATAKPAACRCAATGGSTTRSTWPRSPSSATSTAPAVPITTRR